MREILFRGKRTDNGEWVKGDLLYNRIDGKEKERRIGDIYFTQGDDIEGTAVYDVVPETVGQYTGLTDKNGKKVFEGDILACTDYYGKEYIEGIVKYGNFNCSCCDGVYGWYIDGGDIRSFQEGYLYVIGNIHDNPELLKGGE